MAKSGESTTQVSKESEPRRPTLSDVDETRLTPMQKGNEPAHAGGAIHR